MRNDKDKVKLKSAAQLRRRAVDRLNQQSKIVRPLLTEQERQKLGHELQVHQIELEMQNDELRRSREELELSHNMYAELYDFAPVGYFTFDERGVVRKANLVGAQILEIDRGLLINTPFSAFISDERDRKIFFEHLSLVLLRKVILKCEIGLTLKDGMMIHCQLQSIAVNAENQEVIILTSLVDSTVRKQLEDKLRYAHDSLEMTITERTGELSKSNVLLKQEIEDRKRAEEELKAAYSEISRLQDRLLAENSYLQQDLAQQNNFGEIVGQCNVISQVFSQIEQVAPLNATVLLLGETGTGKGVVARAIHARSARKALPMVTVNCTALPANLIESELFGREKGAFTGANVRQMGRFELADKGTIFLDEIGEMPLELQCKLLRVIQDGEFERLGSPRTIKVDVRIIAASNRNLEEEIKKGNFREDLYYRLNVFPIIIPPLRQRKEDIPLLVNHFVEKYNKRVGKKIDTVASETMKYLQEYYWPGNVRELESIIERAMITSQGNILHVLDRFETSRNPDDPAGQNVKALGDLEHDHILSVLQKTGWRIEGKSGAAILLGLNASTLRARMRKYGIVRK